MAKYKLKTGMHWKAQPTDEEEIRAEAGEVRDDLNEKSIPWLLKQELIELVEEKKEAK